jgi:hypothetical protein
MTHLEKQSPQAIWGNQLKWLLKQMQDLASEHNDCVPRKGKLVQNILYAGP